MIISYSRIRSEPDFLRVQRMKSQHHILSDMTTIRLTNVALTIVLQVIILLNQHGDAFKPQAEAKEGNTHQAAIFASLSSTQELPFRREHEQQDWQTAPESDKRFHFHCKHDAKDNTKLVDGADTVFIRLVDYDLVDGQLAYADGGPPSKPHEGW